MAKFRDMSEGSNVALALSGMLVTILVCAITAEQRHRRIRI